MKEKVVLNNDKNIVKKKSNKVVYEAKSTIVTSTSFIISSITLIAGLAWNEVIKALFSKLQKFMSGWGETVGLFIYAVIVTIIAVVVISRLKKFQEAVGGESIKK